MTRIRKLALGTFVLFIASTLATPWIPSNSPAQVDFIVTDVVLFIPAFVYIVATIIEWLDTEK